MFSTEHSLAVRKPRPARQHDSSDDIRLTAAHSVPLRTFRNFACTAQRHRLFFSTTGWWWPDVSLIVQAWWCSRPCIDLVLYIVLQSKCSKFDRNLFFFLTNRGSSYTCVFDSLVSCGARRGTVVQKGMDSGVHCRLSVWDANNADRNGARSCRSSAQHRDIVRNDKVWSGGGSITKLKKLSPVPSMS